MFDNMVSLHITEAFPINASAENAWELLCYECGFRARISNGLNNGVDQFEILEIGDPRVRHTCSNGTRFSHSDLQQRSMGRQDDDAVWLTAESLEKLNEIIRGLDESGLYTDS